MSLREHEPRRSQPRSFDAGEEPVRIGGGAWTLDRAGSSGRRITTGCCTRTSPGAFSRNQNHWPDRSLSSRAAQESGDFLEHSSYAVALREDIELIRQKLSTNQIHKAVSSKSRSLDWEEKLSRGQRLAVDSFSILLKEDSDIVSMNKFVNLLGALPRADRSR